MGGVWKSLRGHSGAWLAVAVTPDGSRIASGGADQAVRVWDLAKSEKLAIYRSHAAPVLAVEFLKDGTRLVSAAADGARGLARPGRR